MTLTIGTIIAIMLLVNPLVLQTNSAQMPMEDEGPIPHYFGPYPNYATSQLPN